MMFDQWAAKLIVRLRSLAASAHLRRAGAVLLLLVLLGLCLYFVEQLRPHEYYLTVSGGDILSSRHAMAKQFQGLASEHSLSLKLQPTQGSQDALRQLDTGQLDLAFVQSGLDFGYANVVHVATVGTELLHFLVRPGIEEVSHLRGKRINFGARNGGTRIVGRQLLEFAGLREGIDYMESNAPLDALLAAKPADLPEVIVLTSVAPSESVAFLVQQRHYRLLDLPVPASLSLRHSWVSEGRIEAHTYGIVPPVPASDIRAVGVRIHLLANRHVPTPALLDVLDTLFAPGAEKKLGWHIDEGQLAAASGYAQSEATRRYLERKRPLVDAETISAFKSAIGLGVSLTSTLLVVFKWFKRVAPPVEPAAAPLPRLADYVEQLAALELRWRDGPPGGAARAAMERELLTLKQAVLLRLSADPPAEMALPALLLLAIADARANLGRT